MIEQTLSVTDFKAHCLDLLKQIGDRRIGKLTVTRHGKPVAVVTAPPDVKFDARQLYGSMRGMITIAEGADLTEPVFEGEIIAESGLLHL